MPITGNGWELHVQRRGLHLSGAKYRTYGAYQVYRDGQLVSDLNGFICERIGPGDNAVAGNGKRIEAGRYPLWTQFGRYRSIGYSLDENAPGADPMPAIRLEGTGNRDAILIHPAHPPNLYLSSIGCLNPSSHLEATDLINFWDSRSRTIALINNLRNFTPESFQHETMTRIRNAWAVVDGEPMNVLSAPETMAATNGMTEPSSLPISKTAAQRCTRWLLEHFGDELGAAVQHKPYQVKHLCAIVCQETAYKWLKWADTHDAPTIVARSVFDASGDYPGTQRSAFPKNTAAFRDRYPRAFADMLVEEANKTRRLQGWDDKDWIYKGYGIFQFDLQKVVDDEAFFKERQWYDFNTCLERCCGELDDKLRSRGGDLWKAIKAYNGSGPAADRYVANVKVFTAYCGEITGEAES